MLNSLKNQPDVHYVKKIMKTVATRHFIPDCLQLAEDQPVFPC